ncbi:cell division protein FtsZ [Rhodoferax koreense]|uniref:Cell division protein ZipA n=1 Tax=Rhodoferax koreensis TaxID=1842727 RepID=A0A1P8JWE9_9BURK|nr:cell division protein ZipA C-terminal FtsZ-binding domain-containing protein [Rhodoferax koreense]APW38001.1 cell division protein FtsZ [Rhodoferax koreense]
MSSSLQIGLAAAGGLVLAAVVAHGAWTSRRNAPRQAEPEPQDTQPMEPRLDGAHGDVPSGAERQEPSFHDPMAAMTAMPIPLPERRPGMDPLIDVIAPIALESEVSGDAVLAALPPTRRVGSKPFAVEGLNNVSQQWEAPVAGQRYGVLQAGVQLANRTGALNEIEYSEFVMKAQAFADALGGAPEFPEMREEVARGRELDQFANDHDAQLGFTLRAMRTAWSPGYVQQNAARLGFVPGLIPGRMVLPSSTPGLPPILGLSFDSQAALAEDPDQSAIREVSLSLDVPQVDRAEQPFVRMRETAVALAEAMDGMVTDDDGRPLQRDAMDQIGSELEKLYDTLDARDLSAGSALARRLFS